ncbi:hypothetical protein [Amycolatopsis sp. FDAARGOS 1241]|uniref:hypothetical protein n=1 Tax=Amycolatopsis sp. FDAARGOS 1241 TaxID=2778070 RepID=UPI001EF2E110|nr:hypothetical protein [Amycolatopsis sp. FDAARGOS 1241]
MTITSCAALRCRTASARSPSTSDEFCHASVLAGDRDATSFGMAFIFAENASVRSGQILPNSSHVVRPKSITPVSSSGPSSNLSPATASGPYRNAQPPAAVLPEPSGSSTTPSNVTNSITIRSPMTDSFVR